MKNVQAVKEKILKQANATLKRQEWYAENGGNVPRAQDKQYDALVKLVAEEDTPVKFTFTGNTINEKIDSIMVGISQGKITPTQGEKLMHILRGGFEVTQVSELMDQLQKLGLIENAVK